MLHEICVSGTVGGTQAKHPGSGNRVSDFCVSGGPLVHNFCYLTLFLQALDGISPYMSMYHVTTTGRNRVGK